MTFISYAQNFEDIMLNRAFKDVDKGFYIDVGANDPVVDSVTKAFYDKGWRGINIEPVSEWFKKLERERPDDVNLQVAAGARMGNVTFHEVLGTGLSTMDKSIADKHAKEQGFEVKEYKIPVVTLSSICKQYVNTDIHFLKIDVEGAELFVLQGLNLKTIRPWIILVESTLPLTQVEKYEEWEGILIAANYEYCYFDGLNRFYVAKEHHEIKASLSVPPNFFDDFMFAESNWIIHQSLESLKVALAESEKQRQALTFSLQQAEQKYHDSTLQVQALQTEAAQHEQVLQQKETKEKELMLSLLEKETKQQESNALIAEYKQQLVTLQTAHAESEEQRQSLASSLQQAEQQYQEVTVQVQVLQTEKAQHERVLQQKETKEKELMLSLLEKETKQQESNALIAEYKQQLVKLQTELAESEKQRQLLTSSLGQAEQQYQELTSQVQALQAEAAQREQGLRQKDEAIHRISDELSAAKTQIDELNASNHHWWSLADQHSKELVVAQEKIGELNQSSHHWWLESERLNEELNSVYQSKSWIITWPLRKLSQLVQWLFLLPIQFLIWITRLPKRIVRKVLVIMMSFSLRHSKVRNQFKVLIAHFPNVDAKLRDMALVRGFNVAPATSAKFKPERMKKAQKTVLPIVDVTENSEVNVSHLTPYSRQIYIELKAAIAQRKRDGK